VTIWKSNWVNCLCHFVRDLFFKWLRYFLHFFQKSLYCSVFLCHRDAWLSVILILCDREAWMNYFLRCRCVYFFRVDLFCCYYLFTIAFFCPYFSALSRARYFPTSDLFLLMWMFLCVVLRVVEWILSLCCPSRGRLQVKEGDVAWSMTTLCETTGMYSNRTYWMTVPA
jgi:hypothetical protein